MMMLIHSDLLSKVQSNANSDYETTREKNARCNKKQSSVKKIEKLYCTNSLLKFLTKAISQTNDKALP